MCPSSCGSLRCHIDHTLGSVNTEGFICSLAPNPRILVPNQADFADERVCPENILSVNIFVQPEAPGWVRPKDSRGLYYFPERSNQKKSDQGNNITGSAFAQLGYLYYTPEDEWDKDIDPEDHEWRNSGYTVVAMINDDGKLGKV